MFPSDDAARLLAHYLVGNGTARWYDFQILIDSGRDVYNWMRQRVQIAIDCAEKVWEQTHCECFTMFRLDEILDHTLDPKPTYVRIFLALNQYHHGFEARVRVRREETQQGVMRTRFTMSYFPVFWDVYRYEGDRNWVPTVEGRLQGIPPEDHELRFLHEMGWARAFELWGMAHERIYTWDVPDPKNSSGKLKIVSHRGELPSHLQVLDE